MFSLDLALAALNQQQSPTATASGSSFGTSQVAGAGSLGNLSSAMLTAANTSTQAIGGKAIGMMGAVNTDSLMSAYLGMQPGAQQYSSCKDCLISHTLPLFIQITTTITTTTTNRTCIAKLLYFLIAFYMIPFPFSSSDTNYWRSRVHLLQTESAIIHKTKRRLVLIQFPFHNFGSCLLVCLVPIIHFSFWF